MFYDTAANAHGLRYDPFKALVAPRPIGWVSSLGADGSMNLAPYSFFNAVSDAPPMVMFSSDGRKDSVANIEATGEFVCNLATWALRENVNASSAPVAHGISEFALAKLTPVAGVMVKAPRVAEAPAALECKYIQSVQPRTLDGGLSAYITIIGQVVGVYIDDAYVVNGRFDIAKARPIARLGYKDYSSVESLFEMTRPKA